MPGAADPAAAEPAGAVAVSEGPDAAAREAPEPVRIGVIMATGGLAATRDGPVLDALGYAVAQINASGGLEGRPLELLFEDSDSELNVAYRAALRLIERGVPVLFTSCDPYFSRPVREAAHSAGVLVIAPCGPEPPPTTTAGGSLLFASGTSAAAYGRALAEHLADRAIGSPATLVETDKPEAVEMCDSFERRLVELGGAPGFSFGFDRHWIAAQPVVGLQATARALEPLSGHPAVVICAAVGGRGIEMFRLLRSAGVATEVLASAALDGVAWRRGVPDPEPLVVFTESSTFGDDPSPQVNSYFASLVAGDLRRGAENTGEVSGPAGRAVVEDRVGWAVTGAEALWIFVRAVQRTGSLDPGVLAADIESFDDVELWMDSASFAPARRSVAGRALRVIRHDRGAARLVELRIPTGSG